MFINCIKFFEWEALKTNQQNQEETIYYFPLKFIKKDIAKAVCWLFIF